MPKIKIFLDKGNNNNNCPRRVLAQTAKTRGGTPEVPAYREENFAVPEKISIFEKRLAKDCPKVRKGLPKVCWGSNKHAKDSGSRVSPRDCFAHTAILLWHTRTVTPNRIQPPIKNVQNLKRDHVISFRCLA